MRDRLAEEAVCCEPVSRVKFPDSWQITGNFGDLIPDRRFLITLYHSIQGFDC
jgi:hypothetical protein